MSTLPLVSVAEAADVLGLTQVRVGQFCREGRIGQKVGGRWVISMDELHQFAKIPRNPGKPPCDKRKSA